MKFKNFRLKSGLTQTEVSKKLGVSNTTVSMWETGKSYPRPDTLMKLLSLYQCKFEDLYTVKEEPAS